MEPGAEPEPRDQGLTDTALDDEQILTVLEEEAQRSGDIDAWRRYVTALAERGRTGSALHVLQSVLDSEEPQEPDEPDQREDWRLNLGRLAAGSGLVAYGELVLRRVARHSRDPLRHQRAEENLRRVLEWRRSRDEDTRLHELQLAYFTEGLQHGRTGAERYRRLAGLTIQVGQPDEFGSRIASTIGVLEDGLAIEPDSTSLLEALAQCLAGAGQQNRLDETLRRLEELNPESEVLRQFSARGTTVTRPGADDNTRELASFLVGRTASDDSEEADAAATDLRTMVAQSPRAEILRLMFGYALINIGDRDEALAQARLLAKAAGRSHEEHYNVAHLFRACADSLSARRHGELALRYALTDEDRDDAESLLSSLTAEASR